VGVSGQPGILLRNGLDMRRWSAIAIVAIAVSACASPAPSPTASAQPSQALSSVSTDGPFRLELVLPRLHWKAGEPMEGNVILSFIGSAPTTIYGSGRVINFAYAEVGGTRKVEPVWTADCATHTLDAATPISEPLGKSGAASEGDPATAWIHSFILAPNVELPVGTWDATALAYFSEGEGCSGAPHSMETTVRMTVTD
jgi:hypothetical protein